MPKKECDVFKIYSEYHERTLLINILKPYMTPEMKTKIRLIVFAKTAYNLNWKF